MQWERDAQLKAKELEIKTGVRFDYYHAAGGFNFNAYTTKDTVENAEFAAAIVPFINKVNKYGMTNFVSIVKVSDASGISVAHVAQGFAYLINHKMVKVEIDRQGKPAYIALW